MQFIYIYAGLITLYIWFSPDFGNKLECLRGEMLFKCYSNEVDKIKNLPNCKKTCHW